MSGALSGVKRTGPNDGSSGGGGIQHQHEVKRRALLSSFLAVATIAAATGSETTRPHQYSRIVANAAVVENSPSNKIFAAGQALDVDQAKERFVLARQSLRYLIDNFDDVVKNGGGDNVRRYLGTVGTTSGLYGITKVMKALQEEADDVVEYTENMSEFDYALRAADTAAYSANFVEYSAAKTKPEQFFRDAKRETEQMQRCIDAMASEIGMK